MQLRVNGARTRAPEEGVGEQWFLTPFCSQGIAYVDFGFIEPALLGAIAKTAKDGQASPKAIDGQLVTRVAMGVDVLARLHQQIQQVLISMRDKRQGKAKSEST